MEKTSEQKFGISPQPETSCQLVDSIITEVKDVSINICNHNAIYETLEDCQDALQETHDIAIWLDISSDMEKLRTRIEEIRSWGQEWKDEAKKQAAKVLELEAKKIIQITDEHQKAFEEKASRKCWKVVVEYKHANPNKTIGNIIVTSDVMVANCNVFAHDIESITKHNLGKFFKNRVIENITIIKQGSFLIPYNVIELPQKKHYVR